MSGSHFLDRFEQATYAEDPEVGIFEHAADDGDALWISDRLFERLTLVAAAYQLPAMSLLCALDTVTASRGTCEGILDELTFVAERLDDELAVATAQRVADYIAVRLGRPGWQGHVTFEGL